MVGVCVGKPLRFLSPDLYFSDFHICVNFLRSLSSFSLSACLSQIEWNPSSCNWGIDNVPGSGFSLLFLFVDDFLICWPNKQGSWWLAYSGVCHVVVFMLGVSGIFNLEKQLEVIIVKTARTYPVPGEDGGYPAADGRAGFL